MSHVIDAPSVNRIYKVLHLFCGIGGGALGFQQASTGYKGLRGKFETLCGIDVDPEACQDFENITGAWAVRMDLFDRQQFTDFHGYPPPAEWREVTAEDLRAACRGESPSVVFLSAPCKGFSGLLPAKAAATPKYQALNRLTVRSIRFCLEAFADDLPDALLFENVPKITVRGKALLSEIKAILLEAGYLLNEAAHECGSLGGLGQRRKRYLLIARHKEKMASFVYYPPKLRIRSIGDVIGPLPMPDDPEGGPLHRLPRLQWKTWCRLAYIPAGKDWRALEEFAPADPSTLKKWEEEGIRTEGETQFFKGKYGIVPWDSPGRTVIGGSSNGAGFVADPRLGHSPRKSTFGVQDWKAPSGTVTGNMRPGGSSPACVADPRTAEHGDGVVRVEDVRLSPREGRHPAVYRVVRFDHPSPCVTGSRLGSGAVAVADSRVAGMDNSAASGRYHSHFRVTEYDCPAGTITGATHVANGAPCVADPRLSPKEGYNGSPGLYGVNDWDKPSPTIAGGARVTSSNTPAAVADPRVICHNRSGAYMVQEWGKPSHSITGSLDVHQGAAAIADPRVPGDNERMDPSPVIIALDDTWHRPLSLLEMSALQSFPVKFVDGRPFNLVGKSDTRKRERIGNAVPPGAAMAIASQILTSLLVSEFGDFILSETAIWVRPDDGEQKEIYLGGDLIVPDGTDITSLTEQS